MLNFYMSALYFLLMSVMLFFGFLEMLLMKSSIFIEWVFFEIYSIEMKFLMLFDWMSVIFIFTVFFISSMIMFYCCEYMNHDNYSSRFFYLMLLFIISMILVIVSPNFISILLGWDGLGLVSYGLVIYYQNYSSFNSGMLTVLMNRVGDVMIIMSISMMLMLGSWNYMFYSFNYFVLIFLVILAGFTKSAQFPFSSWLPAAMAAPTPVSSLVHSSTLVTAGVYLLIRFKDMVYKNDSLLIYIMFTGLLTMMMAGLFACYEYDFKKIIAYSTLSQLGLMMMIYSMKFSDLSFFHLITHAMFKSMMFMSSGVIIHFCNNYQDIRMMNNSFKNFPLTMMLFMVANFSLCGTPFFSGFYSKDKILEIMFMMNLSYLVYFLLMLSTAFTVIYSCRLMYFLLSKKVFIYTFSNMKDCKLMNYPMFMLMIMSLMFGWFLNWVMYSNMEMIYLNFFQKFSVLSMSIIVIFFGFMFYKFWLKKLELYMFKYFLGKMSFLNNNNFYYLKYMLMLSNSFYFVNDKGWSEYFMKISIFKEMNFLSNFFNKMFLNYLIYTFLLISFYFFIYLCM